MEVEMSLDPHNTVGKMLILIGVIFIVAGILFLLSARFKWFTSLPGNIIVKKENFTFYFPLATCIVISIVLTIVLNLFFRRRFGNPGVSPAYDIIVKFFRPLPGLR